MNRSLSIAILLFLAISANAADRFARDPEKVLTATTGRITKIDYRNKTLKVRVADGQTLSVRNVSQNLSQMMQGLKQRLGVTLPGGITIAWPGRSTKTPSKPQQEAGNGDEYTVVVTSNTIFEDGSEPLDFEDFKTGETVSIRGVLDGAVLTATRVAKWF
jgi:hypothetical protein